MALALAALPMWCRVDPLAILVLPPQQREEIKRDLIKAQDSENRQAEDIGRILGFDAIEPK